MKADKPTKKVLGQARVLSTDQQSAVIAFLEKHSKHSLRDSCMFLLTVKAGLRAAEVANLQWWMVCNEDGQIGSHIKLPREITKGGKKKRDIPMNKFLKIYLMKFYSYQRDVKPQDRLFYTERGYYFDGFKVVCFFWRLYKRLGFYKCSSHSGRRTFITNAARQIMKAGGSLRDIQDLVGHSSLKTTELYIEVNEDAKRRVVDMI